MAYKGIKSSARPKKSSAARASKSKKNPYSKSKKYKGIEKSKQPKKQSKGRSVVITGGMPLTKETKLEQTALSRRGMSLRELWSSTPNYFKNRSRDVVAVLDAEKILTKTNRPAFQFKAKSFDPFRPNSVADAVPHTVTIIGMEEDKDGMPKHNKRVLNHKKVLVDCSCLTGDTKVLTSKGWKTIFELAGDLDLSRYPVKYIVDGKAYKGTLPYSTGIKPVYRMTFSNGRSLEATKDHKFLVKSPSSPDPVWKQLGGIGVGENIVLSKRSPTKLPQKSQEFYRMQFLGFLQGDGTVFKNGRPDLKIYHKDKLHIIDRLADLGIVDDVVRADIEGRKCYRVRFNIKAYEIMRRYRYDNSGVPCFKTKEQFFGYLSGLLCADGNVSSKDNKVTSLLIRGAYSYISPILDALLRYGFTDSSLRLERKAGSSVDSSLDLVSRKDLYCLRMSARTMEYLLHYLELTPRFYTYEFKEHKQLNYNVTKVVDKHYVARKNVYDITVPKIHRFVAEGGVIAHNCENHVFMWEYANATYGASRIIRGNGNPAIVTNPANLPGLCIHLIACVRDLKESGALYES